jgi:hypothetical protein
MDALCGSFWMVTDADPADNCERVQRVVGLATVADSHLQHVQCDVIQ